MVESTFVFCNPNEQTDYIALQYLRGLRNRFLRFGNHDEDKRNAIVQKNGVYRVLYSGLKQRKRNFVKDFYVTLLELKWIYVLAIVCNIYVITYLLFAFLWWLMGYVHEDFDNLDNSDWEPCLLGISGFGDALLFSLETQTTIGYGNQFPDPTCIFTLPLIFIQVTIGFFCETVLLGLIFVKLARPKQRGHTIVFSKQVCVYQQNNELFLQVRVGDLRQSHPIGAGVRGMLVRRYVTEEGYVYPIYQNKVEFEAHGMMGRTNLIWPIILIHKITKDSPLWDVQPRERSADNFELIVFVEGVVESTGETCQARTSFMPREFLWGHKFDTVEDFDEGAGRWHVNFSAFNDTIVCSNLRHSAKEVHEMSLQGILECPETDTPAPTKAAAGFQSARTPYANVSESEDEQSDDDTFSMESYDLNSENV